MDSYNQLILLFTHSVWRFPSVCRGCDRLQLKYAVLRLCKLVVCSQFMSPQRTLYFIVLQVLINIYIYISFSFNSCLLIYFTFMSCLMVTIRACNADKNTYTHTHTHTNTFDYNDDDRAAVVRDVNFAKLQSHKQFSNDNIHINGYAQ